MGNNSTTTKDDKKENLTLTSNVILSEKDNKRLNLLWDIYKLNLNVLFDKTDYLDYITKNIFENKQIKLEHVRILFSLLEKEDTSFLFKMFEVYNENELNENLKKIFRLKKDVKISSIESYQKLLNEIVKIPRFKLDKGIKLFRYYQEENFEKSRNVIEIVKTAYEINSKSDRLVTNDFSKNLVFEDLMNFFEYKCICKTINENEKEVKGLLRKETEILLDYNIKDIERKFNYYESNNNNVFPIKLLEFFLNIMSISKNTMSMISNYLKQKCRKIFISLEDLKELFKDIHHTIKLVYKIISQDSSNIRKNLKNYFNIKIDEDNPDLTYEEFKKKYSSQIFNSEIGKELEMMRYIPYIFFEVPVNEPSKQRNCVKILLGKNTLIDYIYNSIELGKKYYVISKSFWNSWKKYVDWNEENNNSKSNQSPDGDTATTIKGNVYDKDYVVLSSDLFNLFKIWYDIDEKSSERKVIKTTSDEFVELKLSKASSEGRNKFYLEIEINLVKISFLKSNYVENCVMKFEEEQQILSSMTNVTDKDVNKLVKKALLKLKEENTLKSQGYSKTMKFIEMVKKFQDLGYLEEKCRIWTFNNDKLVCPNLNSCLEEENIKSECIIIFDNFKNEFEIDRLFKSFIKKHRKGSSGSETMDLKQNKTNDAEENIKKSSSLVGLKNLGNSK